ncbi:hypothetical protein PBY51_020968 [Eleginops maclovinus]|uniref:Reelin domain-containing protein n=1 Tax=Eleginops maclovinus TaxID=56733 RepID=A0AAN7XA51_ELEMC|nr:hypothetical protein PBY51_020968 [Eleginops maclovinus]
MIGPPPKSSTDSQGSELQHRTVTGITKLYWRCVQLCACLQGKTSSSRDQVGAMLWFLTAVCVACVQQCVCYPDGSVLPACGNMLPEHPPFTPATSSPPYTVSVDSAAYKPGGLLIVTVEVKNSSTYFEGFLLQARSRGSNAVLVPVGWFTNINSSMFTSLSCSNLQNSAVSQASNVKKKKVQLTWEAPSNSNYGDIYFSATLVQDYTTFWVQLNSSTVTLERGSNSAAGVFYSSALLFINLLSLSAFC